MKLKSITLIHLLFAGLLFSQTETRDHSNMETNNLWALQFQVLENFKLSSFKGSTVSLKRKLSDCTSLRFGISTNTDINNMDQENRLLLPTDSRTNSSQDTDQFNLALSLSYLWNTTLKNDISVYYGFGPLLSYGYIRNKSTTENINYESLYTSENITSQNTFGFGTSGVFGVEWFVKDNISFSGEYETYVGYYITKRKYESRNNTSTYQQNNDTTENSFRFQSIGVKLGISIYF